MPPIPIHTNDPISPNAKKADGITPATAPPSEAQQKYTPSKTTAVPTPSFDASSPPPPQPGARPVAPTAPPPSSSYSPPAPPQPSATPQSVTATHTTTTTVVEPPPPPQLSIPAPTLNAAPTYSTTSNSPPQNHPLSTQLYTPSSNESPAAPRDHGHARNHSLEHPPGYQQNPYVDGTAADRARMEAARRRESEEGSLLESTKETVASAAEALKKAHEGAWKWIDGKG